MYLRYFTFFIFLFILIACEGDFAPSVDGGYSSKPAIAPVNDNLMLPTDDMTDSYIESSPEEIKEAIEDIIRQQESTSGITEVRLDKPIRPNANSQGWVKGEPCGFGGEYDSFGFCCPTKNFTAEPEHKCVLDLRDFLDDDNSNSDDESKDDVEDNKEEGEEKQENEPTVTPPIVDSEEEKKLGEPCDDDNPNAKYDKVGECCQYGITEEGECIQPEDFI